MYNVQMSFTLSSKTFFSIGSDRDIVMPRLLCTTKDCLGVWQIPGL